MSTQLEPQAVVPAAQPQAPAEQICRDEQTWPQAPQFAGSSVTSVHAPSQLRCDPGQTQLAAWHAPGTGQTVPQAPQFAPSRVKSTQLAPQAESGAAQFAAHLPRVQTCPSAHAFPQLPQLFASSVTSTHLPAHDVVPARHVQVPPVQTAPLPQTLPHAPQLASSESTDTQTPPQSK